VWACSIAEPQDKHMPDYRRGSVFVNKKDVLDLFLISRCQQNLAG
jgi:hypothetical protein